MIIRVDTDIISQVKTDLQDFLQNELGLKINNIQLVTDSGAWEYYYVIDLEYNPKVSFFMLKYSEYIVYDYTS